MSKDKPTTPPAKPGRGLAQDGYKPRDLNEGYKPQGGYQPTTGKGAPSNPPNKGGGGKKK
jgi:hypothetical protein